MFLRERFFTVDDYLISLKPSFEEIKKELSAISEKLFELLPDKSIGTEERIERLGRLVPHTVMESEYHRTARKKLDIMKGKLNYLVPRNDMTSLEKIDYLVDIAHQLVPEHKKLVEKLEIIQDYRRTDNGRQL